MKKYQVTLTRSQVATTQVEADSKEEAIEKAIEEYMEGDLDWEADCKRELEVDATEPPKTITISVKEE